MSHASRLSKIIMIIFLVWLALFSISTALPTSDVSVNGTSLNEIGLSSINFDDATLSADSVMTEWSGGRRMLDKVNDYRRKSNLPLLKWNQKLAYNSYDTGKIERGLKAKHHGIKNYPFHTWNQVLVQGVDMQDKCKSDFGGYTPFELFFMTWLCEVPNDPYVRGKCPDILKKAHIGLIPGVRGHHDAFTVREFRQIGCQFYRADLKDRPRCHKWSGVWGCDLSD